MTEQLENVKGLSELARVMRELAPRIAKKHLRSAVLAGANEIRDEAQRTQAFSDRTGVLRASIITKFIPERSKQEEVTYFVAVRQGKHRSIRLRTAHFDPTSGVVSRGRIDLNTAYYWRFVEFGTARMEAKPFMRPAFETKKHLALDRVITKLASGVERTVSELRGAGRL